MPAMPPCARRTRAPESTVCEVLGAGVLCAMSATSRGYMQPNLLPQHCHWSRNALGFEMQSVSDRLHYRRLQVGGDGASQVTQRIVHRHQHRVALERCRL